MKLSASGLSTFLRSPKAYYWRYVANLEPALPSMATFDHDKLFGVCWSEFVQRFYQAMPEGENRDLTLTAWNKSTDGWVSPKAKDRLTQALVNLIPQYYATFSPDDGARVESEVWLENDLFCGRLDGLGANQLVHEVKTTSRSPMISEQAWKVRHSLQVRLYCVLAQASAVCIEFAFKDPPYALYRAARVAISLEQRMTWQAELETLARYIQSLGDEPSRYPCHPEGCCLTTARTVSMCPYQILCQEGLNDSNRIFFRTRSPRQ